MANALQRSRKTHQVNLSVVKPTDASQILDHILSTAVKAGASDIHLGANHKGAKPYLLRLRVHGILREVPSDFLTDQYHSVVTRLRVLAGLDTTGTTEPQDGQITITVQQVSYMCRMNIVPTASGEEIAIRISPEEGETKGIETLNLSPNQSALLHNVLSQKSGMIVMNGPAGSGKTTTIYAMLKQLSGPHAKIATVEDPIEKVLPFVSHMQVSHKTNFAKMARAFMRQDADVIFIGEVRDAESAEVAVQLAQTGHLVLTTLHTRDAMGVVPRLKALDIHPNFIATSLIASIAQRLVIVICQHCKVEYQPEQRILQRVYARYQMPAGQKFYKSGPGCDKCDHGIAGRTPIFEMFMPDALINELINLGSSRNELFAAARKNGFTTIGEEALMRVHAGFFDLQDVYGYVLAT